VAPEGGDVLPVKAHDVKLLCLYLCKEDAKQFFLFTVCVKQKEQVSRKKQLKSIQDTSRRFNLLKK